MAAVSPYRGEVEIWAADGDAIAVQSMGWDASLAWGGDWVVAAHGYVCDWGAATGRGAGTGSLAQRLLALLPDDGLQFVGRLRGEFALLAFHPRDRLLFLARDFLGKRPLFHAMAQDRLVVASEIRQVAVGGGLPLELRPDVAVQWIAGLDVPADETEYRSIRRVAPATVYALRLAGAPSEPKGIRYWQPPEEGAVTARPTAADREELGRLLRQAVRRSVEGVGNVAVAVSSGVDSAALWALLRRQRQENGLDRAGDVALSLVFPGLSCDETADIRELHAWCGTSGIEIDASAESPLARTPYLIEQTDRLSHPMAFTIGLLAAAAGERGVKTLLTGHGPDEFLAGRFSYLLDLVARGHPWAFLRDCLSVELRRTGRGRFLMRQLAAAVSQVKGRSARPRPPWLTPAAWAAIEERRGDQGRRGRRHSAQIRRYVAGYQAGGALDAFEQLAAGAAVEHRSPFLDQDLLDFALTLPGRVLTGGRRLKWLFRQALLGWLPDDLRMGWKVSFNCMIERERGAVGDRLRALARGGHAAASFLGVGGLDITRLADDNRHELLLAIKAARVCDQCRSGPSGPGL